MESEFLLEEADPRSPVPETWYAHGDSREVGGCGWNPWGEGFISVVHEVSVSTTVESCA